MQTLSEIEQGNFQMQTAGEPKGWELELQPEGGLLVSGGRPELHVGDAITLTLRLSTGSQVQFTARVVDTEAAGARIELTDLSTIERREFRRWQAQIRRERGSDRIPVEVTLKVRFRRYTPTYADWANPICH